MLALIVEGWTNTEIAEEIGASAESVASTLTSMYARMGASSRAEATVFAAYMAVFNIAASASNTLGGALYETLAASHGAYAAMALLSLIGTAGTLAAWPCLRYALKNRLAPVRVRPRSQGTTRRAPK